MSARIVPIDRLESRSGSGQRRQPESNRCRVPVELCRNLVAIGALIGLMLALFVSDAKAHVRGCHSRACDRRISAKRHRLFWVHRWQALSTGARYWTRCVSGLESGDRRIARESGFLSYFQWTLATWHNAGGSGNPETHSWHEQAVKAWHWHIAHPWGQWPNTGEGGRCGS